MFDGTLPLNAFPEQLSFPPVHCHLVNLLGKETIAGKEMFFKRHQL